MYFKRILLKNVGPLRDVTYDFPFSDDGKPKPVLLVGTNGAGKSIFLSQLLNPLMASQQLAFDNSEVEKNKSFRLRSSQYITTGETCHYSRVEFGDDFGCHEWPLALPRTKYEETYGCPIFDSSFAQIADNDMSVFNPEFVKRRNDVIEQFNSNCILCFLPNRYEEPAWLNEQNLSAEAGFADRSSIQRISGRRILQDRPLNANKDWLLDIVLDRATYDIKVNQVQFPVNDQGGGQTAVPLPLFSGYQGNSANVWKAVTQIIKLVLRSDQNVRFGIGPRQNRHVSVMENESELIHNIFQLSTGQTSVLNFGLSILRDFDLTQATFNAIEDITGVVIIDEIDSHLHADLQCNVLPKLLKLFPLVQFIVTTHSPLFLLGMKKTFSAAECNILSLPHGTLIGFDDFSEFQVAFDHYSEAELFQSRIEAEIAKSHLPVVFVEGDYDIRYLKKAADVHGQNEILDKIRLYDGEGFGNLDRIWRNLDSRIAFALPTSIMLIYDCDTNKSEQDRGGARKRVIATVDGSPIEKGIENLFPADTITCLRQSHPQFFDITPEITKTVRGESVVVPEVCQINRNEKGNMCDYLCEHGTETDFAAFDRIFALLSIAAQPI